MGTALDTNIRTKTTGTKIFAGKKGLHPRNASDGQVTYSGADKDT